ncbi:capsular polysaccharide ABC transporter transmembrane protein [Ameyamaea chiangmaiensis NBRC 103196]|uniref:ABC transporter permease n=1 Tax=Ameyamaea chiangmaiensis TaxID=442969 RepID=A0A850PC21_9PROT|nr:ABC transporter permease [Ameyamaea chiangmaiensis]MBS4075326.1 ABC transporter permease [Ameyamaea chiangmaiensis]NVN41664.1 ABC transporter permease [Ameyamaea chiangmaiensis]GBQ66763.1 capsular polysaccharide ABC transporter transmembrane protein [Ameyamaea chiangmaiensis NBRC 103196]
MKSDSLPALFALQGRVIWALMMRELHTRFGRDNLGFLWIVGEPILFCAGVAIVWSAIRPAHEHGLPTTAIVITGYVPLTMWRHSVARSVLAFEANGSLLFHRQVIPLDIIIARIILEVVGTLWAGLLVGGGAIILGFMKPPENYGLLYLGLFYQIAFCFGCALIIAPLSERSEFVEKSLTILMYLSLPLSGAFAMVDWIPQHYRWILLLSPSVEGIEMIRGGQFGYVARAHYDIVYTTWINFLLILIGISLTLRAKKYIHIQ